MSGSSSSFVSWWKWNNNFLEPILIFNPYQIFALTLVFGTLKNDVCDNIILSYFCPWTSSLQVGQKSSRRLRERHVCLDPPQIDN